VACSNGFGLIASCSSSCTNANTDANTNVDTDSDVHELRNDNHKCPCISRHNGSFDNGHDNRDNDNFLLTRCV
jgi:hypothetical protein